MATPARPARSALAAGAARAGGERARRRTTPLLTAQAELEAAPPTKRSTAAKPPAAKPPAAKRATPATPAATTRSTAAKPPAAKPPAAKPPATKRATSVTPAATTRSATTKRPAMKRPAPANPPRARDTATATPPAAASPAAGTERGKHRPRPVVQSPPVGRAKGLSGERRVPRRSPRATRAADDAAARRLRLAEPPTRRPIDPTARVPSTPLPVPGLEDLVQGAIAALRFAAEAAGMSPEDIERRLAAAIAYVRRRIQGDFEVDEFGYDADFTENVVLPLLRPVYRKWFRVEVRGIENIPAEGGALIVANHSGTVAIDGIMTQIAIHDEHPSQRVMRALGADLVFQSPFVGTYARRTGATLATNSDAERLFAKGELVGVFPEGFKGIGKPFKERYKLQRFGRGGFVSAALKARVPIIPTSIVGAEEIAPIIGNMSTVARLLGLPYVPITPTFPWLGPLGLIPLPSKWIIEFGTPIPTDSYGARAHEDPMLVFDLTDQVRETIQQTLYVLLMQRTSVFF